MTTNKMLTTREEEYNWDVEAQSDGMFRDVIARKLATGWNYDSQKAIGISVMCIQAAKIFADTLIGMGIKVYPPEVIAEVEVEVEEEVGDAERN